MASRRQFMALGAASTLAACTSRPGLTDYNRLAAALRTPLGTQGDVLDLARYASLAPNGHNTQPWQFALTATGIDILPDSRRRTPAVDPDDHHVFVSLGCAAENLCLAAEATGRAPTLEFDPDDGGRIHIALEAALPRPSPLFDAIPQRQTTRSIYTGAVVSAADLNPLEHACRVDGVSVMILTERKKLAAVRDFVVHGNSLQMQDAAFTAELKAWIRFNPKSAIDMRDGLFSGCTGNPAVPTWIGQSMFPLLFNEKAESDKYASQMDSSPGVAVFVGDKADPDHWIKVGRSVQRFALQATALGLKYAVINQPIEVPSVRKEFASWLGAGDTRPDFVLRLGYADALPMSLRRDVKDIVLQA